MQLDSPCSTPSIPQDADWERVLAFWFGTATDDPTIVAHQSRLWFHATPEDDQQVRTQFGHFFDTIDIWSGRVSSSTRHHLAQIIVLDQFSRHLFRDTKQAYAYDVMAQLICLAGLWQGLTNELTDLETVFYLMPLHHAENYPLQKISAQMYTDLAHRSTSGMAEVLWDYAKHAQRYLHIIERFGRFPHRNTVLNRTSSPSESAYLERDTHTGSLH